MEQFKIDIYKRENPDLEFPAYKSLTLDECAQLRATIANKIDIPDTSKGEKLTRKILEKSRFIEFLEELNGGYNFEEVFNKIHIIKSTCVFINWWHFDKVDKISTDDFIKYFEYIWYPSSDDIEIIDGNYNWVIVIDHHGGISLLEL